MSLLDISSLCVFASISFYLNAVDGAWCRGFGHGAGRERVNGVWGVAHRAIVPPRIGLRHSTTQYYGRLLGVWPTYMNISMLKMASWQSTRRGIICWYALARNSYNNTQERCAECTGGLFLIANLLVFTLLAELWGPWQRRRVCTGMD